MLKHNDKLICFFTNQNHMEFLPHGWLGRAKPTVNVFIAQNLLFFNETTICSHHIVKSRHYFLLCGRKHMCIPINIDALVSDTVGNSDNRNAHIKQQWNMRMPLRYNNDKRKKPLFSRGLSVCRHSIPFPSWNVTRKLSKKGGCFINDKI